MRFRASSLVMLESSSKRSQIAPVSFVSIDQSAPDKSPLAINFKKVNLSVFVCYSFRITSLAKLGCLGCFKITDGSVKIKICGRILYTQDTRALHGCLNGYENSKLCLWFTAQKMAASHLKFKTVFAQARVSSMWVWSLFHLS
jgi:hypothetical protein